MNVLYVDIDGVLNSFHSEDVIDDRMVIVLKSICDRYNCVIVIESTHKSIMKDGIELNKIIRVLKDKFKKYGINCIGFTPTISVEEGVVTLNNWKEFEIIYHLMKNQNIEHFAVIDDNDFKDLELLKDHLVETKEYSENGYCYEGLTYNHIEEVGKALKLENKFKK